MQNLVKPPAKPEKPNSFLGLVGFAPHPLGGVRKT